MITLQTFLDIVLGGHKMAMASTTMIELPGTFVSDLTTNANTQIANFAPMLTLILGLLLALIAVGALISFLTRGHK